MYRYLYLLMLASTLTAATFDIPESGKPPVPLGGWEALAANIEYPKMARKAGIEGLVLIKAYISEEGEVTTATVEGPKRSIGFDEAALAGVLRTRFEPARQYNRPMGTWIIIPIRFDL